MVKYSRKIDSAQKTASARGSHLRVHFKHMREVSDNIKGMSLVKAKSLLNDVLEYKRAIKFTKFTGGVGRHAQGKLCKAPGDKVRWPQKATKIVLDLLLNAESNAEYKQIDVDNLYVVHAQANRAPKQRRRTYRAHGRINPYMSNPTHIEIILAEKAEPVEKVVSAPKLTRKRAAQLRVKVGGGN